MKIVSAHHIKALYTIPDNNEEKNVLIASEWACECGLCVFARLENHLGFQLLNMTVSAIPVSLSLSLYRTI